MSRGSTAPVSSRMRSASVDFPWSMWAMMLKLRNAVEPGHDPILPAPEASDEPLVPLLA